MPTLSRRASMCEEQFVARVLSGVQPSGDVHLGNYLGAFKQYVELQDRADAYYCIVDLHSVSMGPASYEPAQLRDRTLDLAMWLLAVGLEPDRATLFVQSHVHEHAELQWLLNCVATMGELGRMIQFKEKSKGERDSIPVGLFDYPVLQAADIMIYQADEVPIGEDQRQHVELTRDIAQRFNHHFGDTFVLPRAIHPTAAARVMDLQNPTAKMSKSADSPRGTVSLADAPETITKKIRSAVTDSGTEVRYDRVDKAGISNLLELMSAATGRKIPDIEAEFDGQGYGSFKSAVADAVVALLRPFQERHRELAADPADVEDALAKGAAKAQTVAAENLAKAKEAMGFLPSGDRVRQR